MASRALPQDAIAASAPEAKPAQPCLFLSHAGIDSAAAVALAERIEQSPEARRHGLTVWIDKLALRPGEPWQGQLEAAILKQSTAFALYFTKAGVENWVRMEVRAALDRAVVAGRKGEVYPFIPIIAESALDIGLLPAFARQFQGIPLADADAVQRLIGATLDRPAATVALVDEPFRGLEAFGAKDAFLFFGRERQTEELIERLKQTNFVMVVGDSGSGKSSLVKADLVPAFKEGRFAPRLGPRPDPALWHVVKMRPLDDPFDNLITGISDAIRSLDVNEGLLSGAFKRLREQDATALRDALREGAPPDAQILLVVDQFEELWTGPPERVDRTRSRERARNAFLDGLLDVARPDDPSRRVVMTMRRDYYNLCSTHEKFFRRIESQNRRGFYNLRRMDDDALRACVERPLALAGVPAGDARRLADEVLHDAGGQPGELALIEMALTETWQERSNHGGDLLASYVAIGRVEGAVRKAADEAYAALDERQAMAEPLFIRLVQLGDTGGTTRRIMHADEFGANSELWRLAQDLGSQKYKRLLVLGRGKESEIAELAHEQLVTQWPQYQRWLQGTEMDPRAADKRTLDQLMEETGRWQERGRKSSDLARGSALVEYRKLERRRARWLAPTETEFVKRSSLRRSATKWGMTVAAVSVFVAGTLFVLDQRQRAQQAERQRIEAVATSIGFQLELPSGEVTSRDAEGLIALASAGRDERLAFVDELFRRPALAERFMRNPAVVTRALVGLNPAARLEVITYAFGPESSPPENPESRFPIARAQLGMELTATEAIEPVLTAIEGTIDSSVLDRLSQALAALAAKLEAEQARQAIEPVLAAMERTAHPYAVKILCQGLAALTVELTAAQTGQGIELVLTVMERSTDPYALATLSDGLAALPVELTGAQARRAVDAVLAAMQRTADPNALGTLSDSLAALPVELTGAQARRAIEPVLAAIHVATNPYTLERLGQALAALAARLPPEQAQHGIAPVLAAMQGTTSPFALQALGEGLAALPVELTAQRARQALEPFLAAMQGADPDASQALFRGLAMLAPKLTAEQAGRAIEPVLAAIHVATNPYTLELLGQALAALAAKFAAAQAWQVLERVLAAIQVTTNPYALNPLGQGLAALTVEPTPARARQALEPVFAAMERSTDPDALRGFGEGLAALPVELTGAQARRAVEAVLAAMEGAADPDGVRTLAAGLATLAPTLTAEVAGQAIEPVLAAMQRTTSVNAREDLGQGLAALAAMLTAEEAGQAIEPILAAMERTTDWVDLRVLGAGLATLAPKLPPEQASRAIWPILVAILVLREPDDPVLPLGQALAALAAKLNPEQARQAIELVLVAIREITTETERFASYALQAIGQGLAAFPVELTADEARQAIVPVLAAIQRPTDPWVLRALGVGLAALPVELTPEEARQAVGSFFAELQENTYPVEVVNEGFAALTSKLPAEEALQVLIDAMKIPWMAGSPTETLLSKLQARLAGEAEPQVGLWETIARIEQRFGGTIDLTSPPHSPAQWKGQVRYAARSQSQAG